jgi:hypothetical protein
MDIKVHNTFTLANIIVIKHSSKEGYVLPCSSSYVFSLKNEKDFLTINVDSFSSGTPGEKRDYKVTYPKAIKKNVKVIPHRMIDYKKVEVKQVIVKVHSGPPTWQLKITCNTTDDNVNPPPENVTIGDDRPPNPGL